MGVAVFVFGNTRKREEEEKSQAKFFILFSRENFTFFGELFLIFPKNISLFFFFFFHAFLGFISRFFAGGLFFVVVEIFN